MGQEIFSEKIMSYKLIALDIDGTLTNDDKEITERTRKALSRLVGLTGLIRQEIMACGDGMNDLAMIRFAELGVAMANAEPEVREAADFVTDSNNDDGVAKAVERFILNEK